MPFPEEHGAALRLASVGRNHHRYRLGRGCVTLHSLGAGFGFYSSSGWVSGVCGFATLAYLGLVELVKRLVLAQANLHSAHPVLELQQKKRKEAP
jgi:hypothetical protein